MIVLYIFDYLAVREWGRRPVCNIVHAVTIFSLPAGFSLYSGMGCTGRCVQILLFLLAYVCISGWLGGRVWSRSCAVYLPID